MKQPTQNTQEPQDSTEVLRFHLPLGVRIKFKLACMKEGKTMSEVLREFIDTTIEGSENPN